MKNKYFTKIILIIILFAISLIYLKFFEGLNHKEKMIAKSGHLDLSTQNLEEVIHSLDGKWEFYPNELKTSDFDHKNYIEVPNRWNDTFYKDPLYKDKKMTKYGCGTYRLRVKLPSKGLYCLKLGLVSSAYQLIINNQLIIENGVMNRTYQSEIATWKPRVVPYYAETRDIEIILQVTNYHHNKGGIINSILIGSFNAINHYTYMKIIKSAIIMGVFAGLGFYLVLLYESGRKKYTYLYLGLFCIATLILESILDADIIYYLYENISFNTISKLEYFVYMGANIQLQLFLKSTYPKESNKYLFIFINTLNFTYLALIILTPIKIFGYSDLIYIVILIINGIIAITSLIKAILNKRKFSLLLLIGIFVMIVTIGIDIIYINKYSNIYSISSNYILGLLFFLLCQIYVLSVDVVDAFESANKAKDMEIAFLQAQIAPHFFFNTLNNIYCLMDQSVPKARNLILDFCDFLRVKHKFDYRKNIYYSLKEEIDLINSFIKIENARCNDAIHLVVDIREEYLSTPIPQLLIQPIVENSIKHGFNSSAITINITAIKKDCNIEITVSDNGKGMGNDLIAKMFDNENALSGVGLKNVNFRLKKCYDSQLKITSERSCGTSVVFEIASEVKT